MLWNDNIVCPKCAFVDGETTDYPDSLKHDGDKATVECDRCGHEFEVTLSVEYSFGVEEES